MTGREKPNPAQDEFIPAKLGQNRYIPARGRIFRLKYIYAGRESYMPAREMPKLTPDTYMPAGT
jgi:hypothetical protein